MICFIHIEKASGSTLHHIFRNNFLSYISTTPFKVWTNEPQNALKQEEMALLCGKWLGHTKGIGGHNTRCFLEYEAVVSGEVQYVTFLREPISRYISHYNHQKFVKGLDWTKDSFFEEARFSNFMTKKIAGKEDVDLAKRYLSEKFAFIGLTEHFNESLLLMKDALHMPQFDIRYQKKNETPAKMVKETFDEDMLSKVRERNLLDIELYRYAREEIYPRYLDRYQTDLAKDLQVFEAENQGFSYPTGKRVASIAYRYLVYRNLEYALDKMYH
jgi:hypothetical protein